MNYAVFLKLKRRYVYSFNFIGVFNYIHEMLTEKNIKKIRSMEATKPEGGSFNLYVVPMKKGINEYNQIEIYGSDFNNIINLLKPIITADNVDSYIKQLREHIKTSDIMYSYILSSGKKTPSDINKKIYKYLKFGKKSYKKI